MCIRDRIQAIYREEKKLKSLTSEERLAQRQAIIKPLVEALFVYLLSLIHISEPTRLGMISYAVFCLKKKKKEKKKKKKKRKCKGLRNVIRG